MIRLIDVVCGEENNKTFMGVEGREIYKVVECGLQKLDRETLEWKNVKMSTKKMKEIVVVDI